MRIAHESFDQSAFNTARMVFPLDDTIAALASASGPARRGIVRISGPAVRDALDRVFRPDDPDRWPSCRTAARHPGSLQIPDCRVPIPAAVCLWPTRRSYTGQPAAEIHTVGSPPLLEAVLSQLYQHGVRPARPGEFTLRAFLAGRVDLVQAEAVLGVIDAPDHQELELALRQLAGGVSGPLAAIRHDLLNLLADLEAGLDFVDEDIEFVHRDELIERLAAALDVLRRLITQSGERMQSTGRRRLVLAGLPNAGKSSLFNRLSGRDAALVSAVRGTTRDYLSAELDWQGTAVELVDTAGWELDAEGIMHGAQQLRSEQWDRADLILLCSAADFDGAAAAATRQILRSLREQNRPVLLVQTKSDLSQQPDSTADLRISALHDDSLQPLIDRALARLDDTHAGRRELLGTTAARCRESLAAAMASLENARAAAQSGGGDEIVALELREALEHLGRILGTVYTDDVLDRIFSRFCIGK
jgi:tRNA modification GTPase